MIRETGLPRWYIKKRAARLGLTMHQDKRPWTAAEEEIIERLVGKVSALTIAKRLKRTEASVEQIAARCGMGTATTLRRHFQRAVGVSPTAYRTAFRG